MAMLIKSRTLIKKTQTLNPNSFKSISIFTFLNQNPELAEQPPLPPPQPSSLPPNPASGSPLYRENWRSPIPNTAGQNLVALSYQTSNTTETDVNSLMDQFGNWAASHQWVDIKGTFEQWIKSLDMKGKPNRPNVELFNQYLRAHLMCQASTAELLDVVEQMEQYLIEPNTASYNLVLKTVDPKDWKAAAALIERMLQSGKQAQPNEETFDIVIPMLFQKGQNDSALNYVEVALKSGYLLSTQVFGECVRKCVAQKRLDTLVSVIEKCKAMDQDKSLSPSWNLCNTLAEVAIQNDNSKLIFLALGFMVRWIHRGDIARPARFLSVNEGLIVKSLSTAARTYDSKLLDASWAVLKMSLRDKKVPNPETYLAKINALAFLGNLPSAFATLRELENKYANLSNAAEGEDLLSPFTSLRPLVLACSQKGYETLDLVYFQLENLARAESPYKSVAALNCVILGCANTWDLDRAYQTFEAIGSSFDLTPNIHSYNALMYAFVKLKKTQEAAGVFEHLTSLGVKPNAMSYSLLVDAHLVNRDPKSAISVVEAMIGAGFKPTRATLLKIRRRSLREMDSGSHNIVNTIAQKSKIPLGLENRKSQLFNMEYSTEFAS